MYFEEEELINTFQPLLNFLKNGGQHFAINSRSVVIDTNGEIKLKDPRVCSGYDPLKDDYEQLAKVILQCALLIE